MDGVPEVPLAVGVKEEEERTEDVVAGDLVEESERSGSAALFKLSVVAEYELTMCSTTELRTLRNLSRLGSERLTSDQ